MGLETGDYISNLNDLNPADDDPTHEGDDHLRLIKNVLKKTFPGDGGGWTGPLTLDLDFLNGLDTTGIPGLITRTGDDPNTIVSIGQTSDDGTDIFTANVNSLVQNWDDGAPQSATIMNSINVVDHIFPVGSLFYGGPDPSIRFTGTTWEQVEGRIIVGVGTGTDANEVERTFAESETGGEYDHTLTENEMPSHRHVASSGTDDVGSGPYGIETVRSYPNDGTNWTSTVGGDVAHNNVQPYVAEFIWRRTA